MSCFTSGIIFCAFSLVLLFGQSISCSSLYSDTQNTTEWISVPLKRSPRTFEDTFPLFAPTWDCADSLWGPSLPAPHLDHTGHMGTSSPGVGPPYAVAPDTSHVLETGAWRVKVDGDLQSRKKKTKQIWARKGYYITQMFHCLTWRSFGKHFRYIER